jgi:hypothetical protein
MTLGIIIILGLLAYGLYYFSKWFSSTNDEQDNYSINIAEITKEAHDRAGLIYEAALRKEREERERERQEKLLLEKEKEIECLRRKALEKELEELKKICVPCIHPNIKKD